MNKYDSIAAVVVVFIIFIAFVGGGNVGYGIARKEAISNGVAYYSVNPTNGVTKFEWKKPDTMVIYSPFPFVTNTAGKVVRIKP